MGELAVLDQTGDTKYMWDKDKPDEVKEAEKTFKRFKKKSYIAYSVNKKGDKGSVMHTFDPKAERIILSPPVIGG